MPDIYEDGVDSFVEEVMPLLQQRGIYSTEYAGSTLRENLGVREQVQSTNSWSCVTVTMRGLKKILGRADQLMTGRLTRTSIWG
jgi:hypothetical protein